MFVFFARRNHPLYERRGRNKTTTWRGAIWCLTCGDPHRVVHRGGAGVVQGVHRGPPAAFVAAFGGVQPLMQGALAASLDFGGEPDQAQEGTGPGDGAFAEPGGRGDAALAAGGAKQGPAVAAGVKVGGLRVCGGHRKDSPRGDTTTGRGDEPVTHQQVMPSVHPLDVLQPPLG